MAMNRRTFLKATLATAGSLVAGPGCSDDATSGGDTGDTGDTGDLGIDTEIGPDGDEGDLGPELLDGSDFFPQSLASGDPRADSVILWTRVEDAASASADVTLELQVALDETFATLVELNGAASLMVTAEVQFDHCVKVRVTALDAATDYYYRFIHDSDGARYVSHTGHARTAPGATDERPVRFAFCSCSDYNGRYYNTYAWMAQQELDFFVHLGDYVYETTGDPQFQQTFPDRVVTFTDEAGAIAFNAGTDDEFFAAKSLSNYRELYKTFRSDAALQQVHERIAMIAVWDDHEFSDDCYGATATYSDGRLNETDVERRKAANQAWFEYMPVDYLEEDFVYDSEATYPDDITIYRDIEYGAHVHLVMTDLRTYRPDHVIPEDALPGAIAMTEAQLVAALGSAPAFALPYVDIATFAAGAYEDMLTENAAALGIDAAKVTGNISVDFINGAAAALNEDGGSFALITEEEAAALPVGLAFSQMFKTGQYGALGSRYFVLRDTYRLYTGFLYAQSAGASEDIMGADQEAWFLETMQGSAQTWKIWGNEFCLVQKMVDLTVVASLPEAFRQRLLLSAEDWDGFPNKRDELIEALADVGNVVAITGDIHAFFAGTPFVRADRTTKIVELVGGAISSASYQEQLTNTANSDPALAAAGGGALALIVDQFLTSRDTKPNRDMAYANIKQHGFGVIEASASELVCTFHQIDRDGVEDDLTEDPNLGDNFELLRFRVLAGSPELYRDFDGEWRRWDTEQFAWVVDQT